jgi:hypothetical protein
LDNLINVLLWQVSGLYNGVVFNGGDAEFVRLMDKVVCIAVTLIKIDNK